MAIIRGSLISLAYQKSLQLPSTDTGDSPVMTLLGTDVERICEIWHEVIAEGIPSIIQLAIAVWLLYREMGAVCVAPVILVFGTLFPNLSCWVRIRLIRRSFDRHVTQGGLICHRPAEAMARSHPSTPQLHQSHTRLHEERQNARLSRHV